MNGSACFSSFRDGSIALVDYDGIEKVLCLTRRKEKYLVVAAVRFLRTILYRNDAYLNRHILNQNLFEPVIQAFTANGNRFLIQQFLNL